MAHQEEGKEQVLPVEQREWCTSLRFHVSVTYLVTLVASFGSASNPYVQRGSWSRSQHGIHPLYCMVTDLHAFVPSSPGHDIAAPGHVYVTDSLGTHPRDTEAETEKAELFFSCAPTRLQIQKEVTTSESPASAPSPPSATFLPPPPWLQPILSLCPSPSNSMTDLDPSASENP